MADKLAAEAIEALMQTLRKLAARPEASAKLQAAIADFLARAQRERLRLDK